MCASLHEACLRRGLLDDDTEWDRCMEEAAAYRLPPQLRALFACLLSMNSPAEPGRLWLAHRDSMCQDYLRDARRVSTFSSLHVASATCWDAVQDALAYSLKIRFVHVCVEPMTMQKLAPCTSAFHPLTVCCLGYVTLCRQNFARLPLALASAP